MAASDWIALNLLGGLVGHRLHRALARVGDPGQLAFRTPVETLRRAGGLGAATATRMVERRRGLARRAERELRLCRKNGIELLTWEDRGYPPALRSLPDAPIVLYVRGSIGIGYPRIAVIGSRNPTAYGRRVASGLGSQLAARGVEVVSGGARGIDTCAHHGALEAEGRTLAVLGSGQLRPYPEDNRELFGRIAERGAVVSEFPLEAEPHPGRFPRRNRLISGLAVAVVVVESAIRSGTLITADHALEQGREVMAIPGPVSSTRSEGCHRLIQQGAKLVQNTEDILNELPSLVTRPPSGGSLVEEISDPTGLSDDERAVLGILNPAEPLQLDQLADRVPFGVARLQAALFGLQLAGAVEQSPGRYYVSRPREAPRG